MLTVVVVHYAQLRERRGVERESVEIPEGTTLGELFASMFPREHAAGMRPGVAVGARIVDLLEPAPDYDEIAFLPPYGGG